MKFENFSGVFFLSTILATDSYKASHYRQYPPGTTKVYSYFEARKKSQFDKVLFFGLNYIVSALTNLTITEDDIEAAEALFGEHFGNYTMFNKEGWQYILEKYNGRLPVRIYSVDEGTLVDKDNVLVVVENTDPNCFWLTNYLETWLVQVWYPTTVATNGFYAKRIILEALVKSGDPGLVDFKLHDFGCRGVTTMEQAMIGGCAHLVNFKGTDTVPALVVAHHCYGLEGIAGFSIPASEHSTITSWGRENEVDAMRNMLRAYPTGLVACVSDSYDIYSACADIWGTVLKDEILARDGTLVIRPDSAYPHEVIPKCLEILWEKFGGVVNEKGYRVLDNHVRMIQGDGIELSTIASILDVVLAAGFSADNIAFGSGGGLLQKFSRDTLDVAFKCSYVEGTDFARDVYKEPVGMPSKNSKRGRLALIVDDAGVFHTVPEESVEPQDNLLKLRYEDGTMYNEPVFSTVRERAAKYAEKGIL